MKQVPRDLPELTSGPNARDRFLRVLASQIGYREGRDSDGDWNNDNAYGLYFKQNRVAWCNWYQSWGAVAAGIPASVIPRTGYTPTSWNWFKDRDLDGKPPVAGDLFWVYGYVAAEGRSRVHHIGAVEKVLSGGRVQTIEGNTNTSGSSQGNGVYRLVRPISSKLRFARPNWPGAVVAPAPKPPQQGKELTMGQYEELVKLVREEGIKTRKDNRRQIIWSMRYNLQTVDELMRAEDVYDAAIADGKTEAEARALATNSLSEVTADLYQRALKNEADPGE